MTARRWDDGYVAITDRDGDGLQLEPVVEQVVGEQPFVAVLHALSGDRTVVTTGLTFDDGLALLQALADALKVERYTPGATS